MRFDCATCILVSAPSELNSIEIEVLESLELFDGILQLYRGESRFCGWRHRKPNVARWRFATFDHGTHTCVEPVGEWQMLDMLVELNYQTLGVSQFNVSARLYDAGTSTGPITMRVFQHPYIGSASIANATFCAGSDVDNAIAACLDYSPIVVSRLGYFQWAPI